MATFIRFGAQRGFNLDAVTDWMFTMEKPPLLAASRAAEQRAAGRRAAGAPPETVPETVPGPEPAPAVTDAPVLTAMEPDMSEIPRLVVHFGAPSQEWVFEGDEALQLHLHLQKLGSGV